MSWKEGMGDAAPRQPAAPRYRIIYPKPGAGIVGTLLNDTFVGMETHWLRSGPKDLGRTIICGLPGECACRTQALPYKWHGYIGIAADKWPDPCVLSLTGRTVKSIEAVAGDSETLRGLRFHFKRATDHTSSKVIAFCLVAPKDGRVLPPIALMPTLEGVYGTAAVRAWAERVGWKDGAP